MHGGRNVCAAGTVPLPRLRSKAKAEKKRSKAESISTHGAASTENASSSI